MRTILLLLTLLSVVLTVAATGRKALFNSSWRFHLGASANANQITFNDCQWRSVYLPYDGSTTSSSKQVLPE